MHELHANDLFLIHDKHSRKMRGNEGPRKKEPCKEGRKLIQLDLMIVYERPEPLSMLFFSTVPF